MSDDADLDTAAASVRELRAFLDALDTSAHSHRTPPYELLRRLE